MTVRKNFTMPDYIVNNLEFIANETHKKQSQVIQDLIQEKMKEYEKEKKLQALENISGIVSGKISQEISIQHIKANSDN